MTKLTPVAAFAAYAKMDDEERSINKLYKDLKAEGYAISRETLRTWAKDEAWDKKVERREAFAAMGDSTIMLRNLEVATAATFEETVQYLHQAAEGMVKTLLATLPGMEANTAGEMATLAKAARETVECIATLNGMVKGGVTATVSDDGVKMTGPAADIMAEWQTYKERTKV